MSPRNLRRRGAPPSARSRLPRLSGPLLALVLAACGPELPAAGPGLPGGPVPPRAATANGTPSELVIGSGGGSVTLEAAAGGSLTLTVPAGAVSAPTDFTIVEVSPNTALGAVGSAFRVAPQVAFSAAVTLSFTPPPGPAVAGLTAARQDESGYWFRVYSVTRDPLANTVTVQTSALGDWTLVTVETQRDLHGPVRLDSNQTIPFTVLGDVVLQFLGEDAADVLYAPTGTLTAQSPVPSGAASCTPEGPNPFPIHPAIAELHKPDVPLSFRWGIAAQWILACDDATRPLISTNFDTLGITNIGCTRGYNGAALVDAAQLQGQYVIDCGSGGRVTAAWDLVLPGATPGPLPLPSKRPAQR